MAVISKQELQPSGKWWTWVNYEGFNTFIYEGLQISEQEAQTLADNYNVLHQYDNTPQVLISIYDNKETIRNAIAYIKTENPNFTQWNNYLATLVWDDALMIRWFLAILAKELANRKDIDLTQWTETEVLSKLKTWIIDTPTRKLEKIIFGFG